MRAGLLAIVACAAIGLAADAYAQSGRPDVLWARFTNGASITLDGVSLTVNDVRQDGGDTHCSVNIIPHTAEATTFGGIAAGRQLNVEIDVLARYLDRMIAARTQ